MEQTSVALPPEQGQTQTTQIAAFTRDISATRQAMEAMRAARDLAEKANAAKSEFLANMSHELRTPITAIVGFTDIIAEHMETDTAKAHSAIQTVQANIQHLFCVINDILDVSKIDAGQMTTEQIETLPQQLVRDISASMRPLAEDKGLSFDIKQTSAIPERIQSDPTRIKQILLNLLSNAIKFTESGKISLAYAYDKQANQMFFSVADTGVGLSPEQLDRVKRFNAFTQADSSTTRKFGGTGLGLRISHSLAKLLGGGIEIESTHGRGSRFSLHIDAGPNIQSTLLQPEQGATEQQAPARNESTATTGSNELLLDGLEILVAEDGLDNQRLIRHYLTKAGAKVTICADGEIACEEIAQRDAQCKPDLVLMDIQMPNLDGYGATLKLREAGFNRAIVALTAHAMSSERRKCLDAGCDEYLTKPIDRQLLIETCGHFARRHRDR